MTEMGMSCDAGYDLARYALPGYEIVIGPAQALCKAITPLSADVLSQLPGFDSWAEYDLNRKLGYVPSHWAQSFAEFASAKGHKTTDQEYLWLHKQASLVDAQTWLKGLNR